MEVAAEEEGERVSGVSGGRFRVLGWVSGGLGVGGGGIQGA